MRCYLGLLILAAVVLGVGQPAFCEDLTQGWVKTLWGMTLAQVKAVYPATKPNGANALNLRQDFVVAGVTMNRALFAFDTKGKLWSINLYPAAPFTPAEKKALTDFYSRSCGAPQLDSWKIGRPPKFTSITLGTDSLAVSRFGM